MQMLFGDFHKAAKELLAVPQGQYFIVAHPSLYTEEMLLTGNAGVSGEDVAYTMCDVPIFAVTSAVTDQVHERIGIMSRNTVLSAVAMLAIMVLSLTSMTNSGDITKEEDEKRPAGMH